MDRHRAPRWNSTNSIGIGRPELVRSSGLTKRQPRSVWLPLHLTDVRQTFALDAINHYLLHPELRATIGTPQEYDRLQRTLAAYPR